MAEDKDTKLKNLYDRYNNPQKPGDRNYYARQIANLTGSAPEDYDEDEDNFSQAGVNRAAGAPPAQTQTPEMAALRDEARQQQLAASQVPNDDNKAPAPPPKVDGVSPKTQPAENTSTRPTAPEQIGQPIGEQNTGKTKPADAIKDEAKKKVGDQAKEWLAKNLSKEAISALFKSLLANPYFWAFVVIVVVFIIAIALFAYFTGTAKSGANGLTPTQVATTLGNKTLVNKLNLLSGDTTTQKMLSQDFMKNAQKDLLALKDQTTNATTKTEIDSALTSIATYLNTPSAEIGNTVVSQIKLILNDAQNDAIPTIQGAFPISKDVINTFNTDLHLGTPLRPLPVPAGGDTSGHGTYISYGQNNCDAVDIYTNGNTDVFSVFAGTVSDVSDDGSGMSGAKKVVIKNGDYQVLYAFIAPSVKTGDRVVSGAKIGTTIQSVLHFEFTYCGVCLITTPLDGVDKDSSSPTYDTWGKYFWVHLLTILKLPTV